MSSAVVLGVGSVVPLLWGLAHILPIRAVVAGFGPLSPDNHRIIQMEWVAEGLTLMFLGLLPGLTLAMHGPTDPVAVLVFRASAGMLIVMAVWTALTGARTANVPIKVCPFVKAFAALCLFFGSLSS